jgi:hypothetical protein
VHTHTCAAAHTLGARQCHHQLVTAACFLLVPPQHFLLRACASVRIRRLCLSAHRRFPPRWVLLLSNHAPRTPSARREFDVL